jgi:V/A-type H+-transporting ATPase subunit D
MAKIKLTKTELKAQRDALKSYLRYLPTLKLKKQQLQMEVRRVQLEMQHQAEEILAFEGELGQWEALLGGNSVETLQHLFTVKDWRTSTRNIAGIDTPVFESLDFETLEQDLFETPLWHDELLNAVEKMTVLRLREQLLEEQLVAIEKELQVTTQRVNLFEKVKIPDTLDNIRQIQIFLADQQSNAVGRAKIAKAKCAVRMADSQVAVDGNLDQE